MSWKVSARHPYHCLLSAHLFMVPPFWLALLRCAMSLWKHWCSTPPAASHRRHPQIVSASTAVSAYISNTLSAIAVCCIPSEVLAQMCCC